MTLFMNLGWELFGGWGIFYLSICYALLGLGLCSQFNGKGYVIPAGICATFVICLTPLAIYGLQKEWAGGQMTVFIMTIMFISNGIGSSWSWVR